MVVLVLRVIFPLRTDFVVVEAALGNCCPVVDLPALAASARHSLAYCLTVSMRQRLSPLEPFREIVEVFNDFYGLGLIISFQSRPSKSSKTCRKK